MRCDVLVVGGGVAGSASAIHLARAGLDVLLVERQQFPRRKVCGECVSANCLHLLDELGVTVDSGPPLDRLVLACGRHTIEAAMPATVAGAHRWGRAIAREVLDPALLRVAQAAGVRVLQPARVLAVGGAPGASLCKLERLDGERRSGDRRNGERHDSERRECIDVTASAVVAANGSWETPLLPLPKANSGLLAFKATFTGSALRPGCLPVLALPGGYGGMVIGADGVLTIACCLRADVLQRLRLATGVAATEAVETYLKSECAAVARALDGAQRIGNWIGSGPIAPGIRVAPGQAIFLVGNAAGEAHPILGEGISMALHGARLLALHLSALPRPLDAQSLQRAQADYARAWQQRFAGRILMSRVAVALAMRPGLAPALLPVLRRWPGVLTTLARVSGKTQFPVAAPAS